MRSLAKLLIALTTSLLAQESWEALDKKTEAIYVSGDLRGAAQLAEKALSVAASAEQKAKSASYLGFLTFQLGDVKAGEKHLREALQLWPVAEHDKADYASTLIYLSMLLRDTARGKQGVEFARRGAEIRRRLLTDRHKDTAEAFNVLGSIFHTMGDYEQARDNYEQSFAMHTSLGGTNEEFGTLCTQLGQLYQRLGQYPKARTTLDRALAVLGEKPGKSHPAYSVTLSVHAFLLQDLGMYVEAEREYVDALKLLREQLPAEHPAIATTLNNQGVLSMMMGNWTAAEASIREGLELKQKAKLPPLVIATTLRNLGRIIYERDTVEAEKLYVEAVRMMETTPSPPAYELANALFLLGEAQRKRGDTAGALSTLARAMEVTEKAFGRLHPMYATASRYLGELHQAKGDSLQAEDHYRRALEAITRSKSADHPDMVKPLQSMARMRRAQKDYRSAYELLRQSQSIMSSVHTQALSIGSDAAKSIMAATLGDSVPELLAFQREAAEVVPESRNLALEAIAMRKARVLEFVRNWRENVRRNANAETRKRLDQWQALVDCRAAISVALGYRELKAPAVGSCALTGTEFEGRHERLVHELRSSWTRERGEQALKVLADLNANLAKLEENLARDVPQVGDLLRQVTVKDLQSKLSQDEMLLEFVLYQPAGGPARYGVFSLRSSSAPQWIELGDAGSIDTSIRDLLQIANDWATASSSGERSGAQLARRETNRLIQRLSSENFAPLLAALAEAKGVQRLRVAPDGMLTLLPFEALSSGQKFLIQQFSVSYIRAGRDLLDVPSAGNAIGPAIIAVSPGPNQASAPSSVSPSPFRAETLDPLPGARAEARSVQAYFPRARILAEGKATEEAIKGVRSPSVLHIIGHGIIRSRSECPPASQSCLSEKDPAARAMGLSAIVLEEAYGRSQGSSQDGLLTALELQSLQLSGSALLVLSQCRMADGVPSSGDGVYGMRRAAALAGARSLVAPLWKITDGAQALLIKRFYSALSQGTDRATALRKAKLYLLKSTSFNHPLYWASLILAGDAGPLPPGIIRSTD